MSHIHFVGYLAEHRRLPVQTHSVLDPDAFERNEFEYYQAPLYYVLAAPCYSLAEHLIPGTGPYAIRLVSLALGVLTVAAANRAGSAFDRRTGIWCAGMLAIFPTAAYFTAIATNDSLAWLIGALWLGALLRSRDLNGLPRQMRFAILIAMGLLAKSSLLCLAPLVFLKPFLAWRSGGRLRQLLAPVKVCAMALAMVIPYYIRNVRLYGSPLALDTGAGAQAGFLGHPSLHRVYEFLSWTVVTFWDPVNIPMGFHNAPAKALLVFSTAACAAILALGWRKLLRRPASLGPNHLLVLSAPAMSFAGYLWYNLRFPQSDARLMFPSLAALLIVSIQAWRALWGHADFRAGETPGVRIHGAPATPPAVRNIADGIVASEGRSYRNGPVP